MSLSLFVSLFYASFVAALLFVLNCRQVRWPVPSVSACWLRRLKAPFPFILAENCSLFALVTSFAASLAAEEEARALSEQLLAEEAKSAQERKAAQERKEAQQRQVGGPPRQQPPLFHLFRFLLVLFEGTCWKTPWRKCQLGLGC